jgi:hypothetical protein
MGDPVLQGSGPTEQNRGKRVATTPPRFYRSGLADVRAVNELAPLPDTADELRAIGKVLGAPPDAINLREAASELRVKTLPLNNYRVIQFATHGLVAGDLSGLAEPALVLTPPKVPTEADDGLLTASEIAALRLNADWAVLSACNTAAGTSQGAEALCQTGVFFCHGARGPCSSNTGGITDAAVVLTTNLRPHSPLAKIGRARLRSAMLSLIAGQAARTGAVCGGGRGRRAKPARPPEKLTDRTRLLTSASARSRPATILRQLLRHAAMADVIHMQIVGREVEAIAALAL